MSLDLEKSWRMLETAEDVTPAIEEDIAQAVEWFDGEPTMGTQEFIDLLCRTYGGSGHGPTDYDLESYDNPAARRIMRIARGIRKDTRA